MSHRAALLFDGTRTPSGDAEQQGTEDYSRAVRALLDCLPPQILVSSAKSTGGLTWLHFEWVDDLIPDQGWKLHVAAAVSEWRALFELVIPTLVERRAQFKMPKSLDDMARLNAGTFGESQLGKIITVYPRSDSELRSLIECLRKTWPRTRGPSVPSDLRILGCNSLFIRFGVFQTVNAVQDSLGRIADAVTGPDGKLFPDIRSSDGQQPAWAPPPPIRCVRMKNGDRAAIIRVNGKSYLPVRTLYESPKASVVLALGITGGGLVVLKSSKRGVASDVRGYDGPGRLRREFEILRNLDTLNGTVPRAIAYANGREAHLILEDIDGVPLDELPRAQQMRALLSAGWVLASLHDRGIVHRDVKPANMMWRDGSAVLVDFEFASKATESFAPIGGTDGYLAPEGAAIPPHFAIDVYAFGASIASVKLKWEPSSFSAIGDMGRAVGLLCLDGHYFEAGIVAKACEPEPGRRPKMKEICSALSSTISLSPTPTVKRAAHTDRTKWASRACIEAGTHTRSFQIRTPRGVVWRNDHLLADHLGAGLNIGAAGVVLGLVTIDQALGAHRFESDIFDACNALSSRDVLASAPGFFTGQAGVALALAVAAKRFSSSLFEDAAEGYLRAATEQTMAGFDLFGGLAGALWSCCLVANVLDEEWPLTLAVPIAEQICTAGIEIGGVLGWPSSPDLDETGVHFLGAAHGSAGVALALAECGKLTAVTTYSEVAIACFKSIYAHARTEDENSIRRTLEADASSDSSIWCHGIGGYLWCLMQAFGDHSELKAEIDWAANTFLAARPSANATYCHGLAGYLEMSRLLSTIDRLQPTASNRANWTVDVLRLFALRDSRKLVWPSDDPTVLTPDLWIGYLAPASALALYVAKQPEAMLSAAWLRNCAGYQK